MLCANCKKSIEETDSYFKAGPKDTVYCSKKCIYQGLHKFYTKNELDRMMQMVTRR